MAYRAFKHRAGGSLFHRHRTYPLFANFEMPTWKQTHVLALLKSANRLREFNPFERKLYENVCLRGE